MLSQRSISVTRNLIRITSDIRVNVLLKRKFSRLSCNSTNFPLRNYVVFNIYKGSRFRAIYCARQASNSAVTASVNQQINSAPTATVTGPNVQEAIASVGSTQMNVNSPSSSFISEIPDAPIPLSKEVAEVITGIGEPTFSSLGLGGYGPIGLVQYLLEYLHISMGMPWWAVITTISIISKIVSLPMIIKSVRITVEMKKHAPEIQKINERITEARQCGNEEQVAIYYTELMKLNPQQFGKVQLISVAHRLLVYLPIFLALKRMTDLPVESLKTGGLWWFTNLTTSDPYYALPLMLGSSMFFMFKRNFTEPQLIKGPLQYVVMGGIPVLASTFTLFMPSSIVYYWFLNTFSSVIQNEVLKTKKAKSYFRIPDTDQSSIKTFDKDVKKSFTKSITESWTNLKIAQKLKEHQDADEIQFKMAGKAPPRKTYKENPVKQRVLAKQK